MFNRKTEGVSKTKARIRAKLNQTSTVKAREIIHPHKAKILRKELLEEHERRGHFLRIYPTEGTSHYNKFFVVTRCSNTALYQSLYCPDDLITSFHLRTSSSLKLPQHSAYSRIRTSSKQFSSETLTGEDLLIEYLTRLINILKLLKGETIKPQWKKAIESFILHYVWNEVDHGYLSLSERLNLRLIELKERKTKLTADRRHFANEYKQKQSIVKTYSAVAIETLLRHSSNSRALAVISCLIPLEDEGILSSMNISSAVSNKQLGSSLKDLLKFKRPYTSDKL